MSFTWELAGSTSLFAPNPVAVPSPGGIAWPRTYVFPRGSRLADAYTFSARSLWNRSTGFVGYWLWITDPTGSLGTVFAPWIS